MFGKVVNLSVGDARGDSVRSVRVDGEVKG